MHYYNPNFQVIVFLTMDHIVEFFITSSICSDRNKKKSSVCVKTSEIVMEDKAHSEGLRRSSRWRKEDRYETENATDPGHIRHRSPI